MTPTPHLTEPDQLKTGAMVRVRARRWLIRDIVKPKHGDQDTLVHLVCIDDDAHGEPLSVLWQREWDAELIQTSDAYGEPRRGFDPPDRFSAWLHTLYWNRVTAADKNVFQAPFRAGIEVKTYQLAPLQKALRLPRVNLFIADDVGLGKTIEAGLILRELILRQRVQRVVILAPPSVVVQWHDEMAQRFGLHFQIYDRDFLIRTRRERGHAVNPWHTHNRFIMSHALVRNETYAASLRQWLGDFSPGTLLILDEAHNAAPAAGAKYAVDSHFTRIIRGLAHRFEHKLFLSATPHNGHSNSFTALLELLDPQRFCRGIQYPDMPKRLGPVMVRRLKKDLRQLTPGFPERILEPIIVDGLPEDSPELQLSHLLQQYRAYCEQATGKKGRGSRMLVVNYLQKRLLSSIPAFLHTLEVHLRSLPKNDEPTAKQAGKQAAAPDQSQRRLLTQGLDGDDPLSDLNEEEVSELEDSAVEQAGGGLTTPEARALLKRMRTIARAAATQPDSRVQHLIAWIQANQCPELGRNGAPWLPRRLLIFTEYTATKTYLERCLARALHGAHRANERVATFQGGLDEERREWIKQAFNQHPDEHPLRILIATDAAREGVNLQNHCYDLIHFDVPWNPARMEQRNGRIDRKLQKSPRVYCRYFVLPQRPEDSVLDTLMQKTDRILNELGSMSPVVVRRLEEMVKEGINHEQADALRENLGGDPAGPGQAVVNRELEFTRETAALKKELDELAENLDHSKKWLNLSETHFRAALSTALQQLGAPPLQPEPDDKQPQPYRFPALEHLQDAGPGWAGTLDSLRTPRPRDAKLWAWRQDAPIRPVVFRDPGNLDQKEVHLHLEHRVVQRLLGGFKTQGFQRGTIYRACALTTRAESVPHVLLISRLSLYGPNAGRLYDDLLCVAAPWSPDPDATLTALDPDRTEHLWHHLLEALADPGDTEVDDLRRGQFAALYARDLAALEPTMQQRLAEREKKIRTNLRSRGDVEARQMRDLLRRQKELLQAKVNPDNPEQLGLPGVEEQNQYRREQKHWETRLREIDEELVNEPRRISGTYAVKASRVEPTAVVWLWPANA
ncbi:DISARM system SNF2-like helicase DrmD [Acanthopleuribacter pedis]|uniref:DISARM system SNF2-like helicase DrmD n=1 Tax=Acanthopleuribacter pedis TaxID=442870 RepID=A0A8J7QS19_9BACT|nr:DISARM system SNF2-like helicase DrmD [Acanthopleuribacter pedis]MBO1323215.1 DISARM system SNF2-like helicase DrmD [Acanthopleuribacter pedis]